MADVEPIVEEDEHPSLELAIDEEHSDASAANKVFILSDDSPL